MKGKMDQQKINSSIPSSENFQGRNLSDFLSFKWGKDISIFVPCYNEEGNILDTFETIISALKETNLTWEIIVIDDASTDNSVEIIRRYKKEHPEYSINLKIRDVNTGLAQNYIDGAFLARGKYYKLVSGDNAEPKETLGAIFRQVGKTDMVIPYHVKIQGRGFFRHLLSKTYTFLVNAISGHHLKYYNGGAVHCTYNVMRWHTDYHGFSFQADIISRLLDQGMSYIEVPVTSQERQSGTSKAIRLKNFLSVGHFFLDLIIRRIGKFYRKSR